MPCYNLFLAPFKYPSLTPSNVLHKHIGQQVDEVILSLNNEL